MKGRWALGPEVRRGALARGAMLYDHSRVSNLTLEWFTPRYWESRGVLESTAGGRGAAWFFSADGKRYVLRHYRRGGLAARLSTDTTPFSARTARARSPNGS